MNVRQTMRESLRLLSARDQKKLLLATLAQMLTSFMDLIAILVLGVVTSLALSAVGGGPPPQLVVSLLDRFGFEDADPIALAIPLAMAAALLLVTRSAISIFLVRRVLRFLANRQAVVSGELAAQLLARPLLQVQRRSSQTTAYALTGGVQAATMAILGQGVVAVTELTLLIVLAIGLLTVSPIVTLFTIAFFLAIALVLQRLLSGWAGRLGLTDSHVSVQSYEAVQEAINTYREALVANRRGHYVRKFRDLRWQASSVQADFQFMALLPKYVFEIALVVGACLLAASQFLTKDAAAALGIIVVFLAAGSRIVPSMMRLQSAATGVRTGAGQALPTFELAAELREGTSGFGLVGTVETSAGGASRNGSGGDCEGFSPTISVIDVTVSYPDAPVPALTRVSIDVPPGSSLALVGPTGAGKSTLADVILGVLVPDTGTVLVGGVEPLEAIAAWPGGLAYVPQEVAMANGTVRDNVALGLPGGLVDDEGVWEALERAHLAEFLRASREGLDTVIGEHGVKLSGGQRQRLGVARALYTRPRLLVLDEATSALDAETEQAISRTLQDLEGSVTTVTVAHRLATIRHCDLVAYLEGGQIVALGTFEEVRSQSRHFDQQAQLLGL